MEVLLAGNTRYITKEWIEQTFPSCHVVVLGCECLRTNRSAGIVVVKQKLSTDALQNIFEAYTFDRVVWFSSQLTPGGGSFEELDLVHTLFRYCDAEMKVLYLRGLSMREDDAIWEEPCERLCERCKAQVQQVILPWLYDASVHGDLLENAFEVLSKHDSFVWPMERNSKVCFLAMDDLSKLIYRMFENWTLSGTPLVVPDCFGLTMEQLAVEVNKLWSGTQEPLYGDNQPQTLPDTDMVLRKRYNWFPHYCILDDLPEQKINWQTKQGEGKVQKGKIREWMKQHTFMVKLIELILGCLAAEFLTRAAGAQLQFKMIDFRLLYIVLMGTVYGMQWGIAAAGLESLCLIPVYAKQNINWITLFYEPTNWVVFIGYFTAGAVCGYVRGKGRDDLLFLLRENENIRKKFSFIRQLYKDTVQRNQELRRQIVSSQDSFGKIFRVTQELDVVDPKEVFLRAIKVLEELLNNDKIAIYSLGTNKNFARLESASRTVVSSVPQSLRMDQLAIALPVLERGEVWANNELLPDMPMYVAAAKENGEMVLLIEVLDAEYEQMTIYYQNLFKVLCGLIQASLLRSLQVKKIQHAEQCVPGTFRLLKPEVFRHEVEVAEKLQEEHVSCYQLIRIDCGNLTVEEAEQSILGKIRENDEIGLWKDGSIWLLLTQAFSENLHFVIERLESTGLSVQAKEELEG